MIRRAVLRVVCVVAATLPAGPLSGTAHARSTQQPEAPATYIVVLDGDVRSPRAAAHRHADELDIDVEAVYARATHSYLAELTEAQADDVRELDDVTHVERDRNLHIAQAGQIVPTGVARVNAPSSSIAGIDGVDDAQVDVDVAVLDSGVSPHPDLNLVSSVDCSSGACVEGGADVHGHGTYVAGIVGATDNGTGIVGVAPGARIHAVRVCDEEGACSLSALLAGIGYVASWANVIEVANLSLGAVGSAAVLDQAISQAVDMGVVFAVAAGNEAIDAGQVSPASHPDVLAVSGMGDSDGQAGGAGGPVDCMPEPVQDDTRIFFSNYGQVIDLAAPGACITSLGRDGGYAMASGTSSAAPHVAGAAALLASGSGDPTDRSSALAIGQRLIDSGSSAWVDDSGDGYQEPLLDVGSLTATASSSTSSPGASSSTGAPAASTSAAPTAAPAPANDDNAAGRTTAPTDELSQATTEWVYAHTPESVDWEESGCIAWAVIYTVGADLISSVGGDLAAAYQHTSAEQDAAISRIYPQCLDEQSMQEMQSVGWIW